jgi:acetoin:2,6-dichlorophenolindophenol oxidoreductase subunit beta
MSIATASRTMVMTDAIRDALDVALGTDPTVFLLGAGIHDPKGGRFGIHRGLEAKYGSGRVRGAPMTEQAIVGAAVGATMAGMRPVAEIMRMNSVAAAAHRLFDHAAKLQYTSGGITPMPLTVRTTGAGMGSGARHSDMLEAQLVHTPGLKVVVPSTAADAKGLLLSCIFDDDPCVIIEMDSLYLAAEDKVPVGDFRVRLGSARVAREGTELTLITYGRQVLDCLSVSEQLAREGISIEVVDLRSLQPLDTDTVFGSVIKTRRAIVVHEAVTRGGFGAELAAQIHSELFADLSAPVGRVGGANTPVPYASSPGQAFLPIGRIESAVRALLG